MTPLENSINCIWSLLDLFAQQYPQAERAIDKLKNDLSIAEDSSPEKLELILGSIPTDIYFQTH